MQVRGIPFPRDGINKILCRELAAARRILSEDLALGCEMLDPAPCASAETNVSADNAFIALGRSSQYASGECTMADFVNSVPRLRRRFFRYSSTKGIPVVNRKPAKRYLASALAFERRFMPILHILTAAGLRGSDYAQLQFRYRLSARDVVTMAVALTIIILLAACTEIPRNPRGMCSFTATSL